MSIVLTSLGKPFDLTAPRADDIDPRDIAHALANLCRFNGHTRQFYSVAQHSCLVADLVPEEHQLAALLHNAPDAYIGHMIEPLKQCVMFYRELERLIWTRICERFQISSALPDVVQAADLIVTATERRDLLPHTSTAWVVLTGIEPLPATIRPWRPQEARDTYFQRLMDQLSADHRSKAV
jgi:5'-deoxynucleotidase YfbR-like HD superfamily hydrolase